MESDYSFILKQLPTAGICLLIFALGYWLGTRKSKKLFKQMAKMEKKIMDLNTELLYGTSKK